MKRWFSISKTRKGGLALVLCLAATAVASPAQEPRVEWFRSIEGGSYLGIEMEDVTADNMAAYKLNVERGVIVRSVERDSPAESASLKEKDVIVEYDGIPVTSAMQLSRLVQETPIGRKVGIVVSRDGQNVPLTAKIDARQGAFRGRMFRLPYAERGAPFAFSFPRGDAFIRRSDRPRLGITLEALTPQMGDFLGVPDRKGALITSVEEGSAAASAKLKAGDVIIKADDSIIDAPEDVMRAVEAKDQGAKLELKIIRERKETSVTVELPGREDRRSRGFRL